MLMFLKRLFTWWNGATLNTLFYTWRHGERVGTDDEGNVYYRAKSAIPDSIAERRWVIFKGYSEASKIPPGWHAWMHHRTDTPPTDVKYTPRDWQKPHQPNETGTALAYRPPGSIVGVKPAVIPAPDYQAWRPE
jgi:NADH:ubiquinone oxidoreductase subunit